jgi:hypothetical protein
MRSPLAVSVGGMSIMSSWYLCSIRSIVKGPASLKDAGHGNNNTRSHQVV